MYPNNFYLSFLNSPNYLKISAKQYAHPSKFFAKSVIIGTIAQPQTHLR